VKDTGIGIAPELIGQMFEPFAQGPQALDRGHGGLGLGLATVKALVELHGGHVTIRSEGIGHGTEAIVNLPGAVLPAEVRASTVPPSSVRRRVMVVEDMRDSAHALQQALILRGHDVQIAYDGKTGLELAASYKPDVVLCDIGLPDLDGFAFARRLRAKLGSTICLVALSGYARAEDVARARRAGFDRHLAKPASLEEIDRVLASLGGSRPGGRHDQNALH
jgi:two-component system CheB/CheR fusion protein